MAGRWKGDFFTLVFFCWLFLFSTEIIRGQNFNIDRSGGCYVKNAKTLKMPIREKCMCESKMGYKIASTIKQRLMGEL